MRIHFSVRSKGINLLILPNFPAKRRVCHADEESIRNMVRWLSKVLRVRTILEMLPYVSMTKPAFGGET
jgi:hypothetical protein